MPGGQSDARNRESARALVDQLIEMWDSLAVTGALPEQLYVVELGVGPGCRTREACALAERGAGMPQIDEPFLAGYPEQVRTAVDAVNVVTAGVPVEWALHVCYLPVIDKFGWDRTIGLGVIDVKSDRVETPDLVAERIRRALELVPAERMVINPDCGLRNLTGDVARAKLAAMVAGAAQVRSSL